MPTGHCQRGVEYLIDNFQLGAKKPRLARMSAGLQRAQAGWGDGGLPITRLGSQGASDNFAGGGATSLIDNFILTVVDELASLYMWG